LSILTTLHLLAAVVWVGGMFFAYLVLRPAAGRLSVAERLQLWCDCFSRFFLWVWLSVLLLLVTGYAMLFGYYGGFGGAGVHIHIMHLLGWLMFLLYGHVYFSPWRKLKKALSLDQYEAAARQLGQIRLFVAINLTLGLAVIAVASGGRYLLA